ncbi:type II toxin-antitoxin system RatA family toxin [Thiomicrorhabdus indica]|uniref:type II toxin-antitoxin system RatA family toxin n=1 Tax=Thiomicrorhabdus indica TaxID=2267253 RepID=UPI00102DF0E5|nr:type II toxin-antitoxin system RatA family toxin [Thiomicrorhabdus indica]
MKKITRSALLPYSAKQMYDLVNAVERYPDFLPWCGGANISESTENFMRASVTIAKAGISQTFTTENHLTPNQRIEMTLLDGPFKSLHGEWHFKALDENACKILFEVEFEMKSGLLNMAIGPIFEQISSTFVDSFVERAKHVY